MTTSFSQSIEMSHERRVEQLRTECASEGIEFINVKSISLLDVNSAKAAVGSTMTSLVGGKAEYDFLQIYTLRQNNQVQYYYQPFSGLTPLPGQHFKILPGSIKNPIQYRIKKKQTFSESLYQTYINRIPIISQKKIRVCEWLCVDSVEQDKIKRLKQPFLKNISHVWQNGITKIELDWTFQANAINHEFTLVSMQTGRYGMLGERSGLNQYKQICSFVNQYAQHYTGDGSNNVMTSNTYLSSVFSEKYRFDDMENEIASAPVWQPRNAVRAIITNLLMFGKYKKVYLLQNIEEKKLKNLQACILDKNNIKPAEVIAAAAMDTFGNMKCAAVFTKDKLYISDTDYEQTIDLTGVRGCGGLKGVLDSSLELLLSNGETTKIKVGLIGEFLNDFFKEISNVKVS